MPSKLENMRKEIAQELYEDIARAGGVSPKWFYLDKPAQASFEKMAGVCFDVLFRKSKDELYAFFYGEPFDIDELAKKNGYILKEDIAEWSAAEVEKYIDEYTLHEWAERNEYKYIGDGG